jgi:hypothetical protein
MFSALPVGPWLEEPPAQAAVELLDGTPALQ